MTKNPTGLLGVARLSVSRFCYWMTPRKVAIAPAPDRSIKAVEWLGQAGSEIPTSSNQHSKKLGNPAFE
jgi:hypothetical protein